MNLVASGTVTVRALTDGREWEEIVEVFEGDLVPESADSGANSSDERDESDTLEDTDGTMLTPEDVARRVARNQTDIAVETLGVDIS